ncbi:hypothetical protein [Spirosoma knui]
MNCLCIGCAAASFAAARLFPAKALVYPITQVTDCYCEDYEDDQLLHDVLTIEFVKSMEVQPV